MKIGYVLDDSLDKSDGVQQYILTIGQWFSRHGHDVHYLVGETKRQDVPQIHSLSKNIKVRFNRNRMSIPLPVNKNKLRKIMEDEQFDIIHVQVPYSPMLGAKLVSVAQPPTRVIGTFHILPYSILHQQANLALGLVLKRNLAKFDKIISVSSAAQEYAKRAYGIDSIVIPNAVDINKFKNKYSHSSATQIKRIVFLGRLVDRKGCGSLLKAVKELVKNGYGNICVDIYGRGEKEASLKQYVKKNNLDSIVKFHGYADEQDKAGVLASADIAVFPSLGGESFGIVLIEAMAAGSKVVLGGDNPGYATVLPSEQLVDPRNALSFAAKLRYYLEDSDAINVATKWQTEAVVQYDVANVANRITKVYTAALRSLIA